METLSISSFPYYSFEDRIYYFDSDIDEAIVLSKGNKSHSRSVTLLHTFTTACGHGLMILTLLDFVRLHLGIPLVIGGVAFSAT